MPNRPTEAELEEALHKILGTTSLLEEAALARTLLPVLIAEVREMREALMHIAGEVEADGTCLSPCQSDAADIAREVLGMPSIEEAVRAAWEERDETQAR